MYRWQKLNRKRESEIHKVYKWCCNAKLLCGSWLSVDALRDSLRKSQPDLVACIPEESEVAAR